jgi:hypothetical protein
MKAALASFKTEPAAWWVTGLGTVIALIIAFGHLTTTEAGTLSALGTAIGTIITAALARPVNVAVIAGAAGTILQSLVIFNVHLSSGEIAALVQLVNLGLGLVAMRMNLTPNASLKPAPVEPSRS